MPSLSDLINAEQAQRRAQMTHGDSYGQGKSIEQMQQEAAQGIYEAPGRLAQGAFTGLVGAPVDIANMALAPFGLGSQRPVGGSNYLASLINAPTESAAYQAGTMLPISPEGLAVGGAKLAGLAGIFAGKGAKTANLSELLRAEEMAKAGVPLKDLIVRQDGGNTLSRMAMSEPQYKSAIDKAREEQYRANAFDIEAEKKSIAETGDADISSIFSNPKLWDAENEEMTQAGLEELDKIYTQKAIDNLRLPDIEDIESLDRANPKAQYAAMKAILDEKGIPYNDTSSAQSKYLEVGGKKLRFADHANMVRDTAVRGSLPIINVAPNEYKFSDALKHVENISGQKAPQRNTLAELANKNIPQKTEFELAHEVAQRNAALPVEQGGLGLHPDNTAMDRARAMGFDTPAYHGTNADIQAFDPMLGDVRRGTGTPVGSMVVSSSPDTASTYAGEIPAEWIKAYHEGGNVMPLMINKEKNLSMNAAMDNYTPNWNEIYNPKYPDVESTNDFANIALLKGKKSATVKNVKDNAVMSGHEGDTTFLFDPSNIRSRFAAFDPMQRNSANILAGGFGGAIGLNTLAELANQPEYQ